MANIRLVTVTRRLHQIPFELIKIDDNWFIDQVIREDLRPYLKRGDHLLVRCVFSTSTSISIDLVIRFKDCSKNTSYRSN